MRLRMSCAALIWGAAAVGAFPSAAHGPGEPLADGVIRPEFLTERHFKNVLALTLEQQGALARMLDEKRMRFARDAQAGQPQLFDGGAPASAPQTQTFVAASRQNTPAALIIGRNVKNLRAEGGGEGAATIAINNRAQVLFANDFGRIERSTNHGGAYAAVALPAGPADAPTACCDVDMAMDDATKTGFVSALYVNAATTNGVVRIFVRPPNNLDATLCAFTIDPGGRADNLLPDFPRIALSRDHLYLAVNALPAAGAGFSRMYRFNLAQMRSCAPNVEFTSFTQSHASARRVWSPAEGAYHQPFMAWVQHDSPTTLRIFHWADTAPGPTQHLRQVSASNFDNPDCRGGVGNVDYIERPTSWSIAGYHTRTVVAQGVNQLAGIVVAYWNSAPIAGMRQGHVRSAIFSLASFELLAQPHIFNQDFCLGFPTATANALGDIGITLAYGGRAGGGGEAARAAVGIDDPFTPGFGAFSLVATTAGVVNRDNGGDSGRFSVRPYQTCPKWFAAANFAWDAAPTDGRKGVNARWIEFGREAHRSCYQSAQ